MLRAVANSGTANVTVGGNIQSTGTEGTETISLKAGGNFNIINNATVQANHAVNFVTLSGDINLSGSISTTGTTGSEVVSVTAQGNITQTGGTLTSSGSAMASSVSGGDVGTSTQPIMFASPWVTLNSDGAGGSAYGQQSGATAVKLGKNPLPPGVSTTTPSSAGAVLQFTTSGALTVGTANDNIVSAGTQLTLTGQSITVPGSASSGNGSLTLNATSTAAGAININGPTSSISSTGGDTVIQLGTIATPYPNDPTAAYVGSNLTVTKNGTGSTFWGTAQTGCTSNCGIAVAGSNINTVTTNAAHNVSFDTKGVLGGISTGSSGTVSITAN